MSIKFFKNNVIDGDGSFTFTSADTDLANYLYDNDMETRLPSVGSDDVTDEVWEIEFAVEKDIDRIFIGNHNIKVGEVEYWTGAAWASFSTPVSLSANSDIYSYFEFNSVNTLKIRFTMETTIAVDDEKRVGQLRAFEEIGEVVVNPSEYEFTFFKKQTLHRGSTGGSIQAIFGEKYQARMLFSDAPSADVTLFETLNDLYDSFFIYPGGGDSTISDYGFRIQDMYLVNYVNDFAPNLKQNLFGLNSIVEIMVNEV